MSLQQVHQCLLVPVAPRTCKLFCSCHTVLFLLLFLSFLFFPCFFLRSIVHFETLSCQGHGAHSHGLLVDGSSQDGRTQQINAMNQSTGMDMTVASPPWARIKVMQIFHHISSRAKTTWMRLWSTEAPSSVTLNLQRGPEPKVLQANQCKM